MKDLFITHKNDKRTITWIAKAMNISINTLKEWSAILKK